MLHDLGSEIRQVYRQDLAPKLTSQPNTRTTRVTEMRRDSDSYSAKGDRCACGLYGGASSNGLRPCCVLPLRLMESENGNYAGVCVHGVHQPIMCL